MSVSCYLFAFLRETWILMKENLHELPRAVHKWYQLFYVPDCLTPSRSRPFLHCGKKKGDLQSIDWTIHGFGFLLVVNYKFCLVKAKCSKDGQGCRKRGLKAPPPHFLAKQFILSQPGGQIMPTTVLRAPPHPTLCVEMGFTWTFPRNQDAKVKLKSGKTDKLPQKSRPCCNSS